MTAALSFFGTLLTLGFAGTVVLRTAEGRAPRLLKLERIAAGYLLGTTGGMFLLFLSLLAGLPLSRAGIGGFLAALFLAACALAARLRGASWTPEAATVPSAPSSTAVRAAMWILGSITAGKLLLLAVTFALTPSYLDDTLSNWNMRAKVFMHAGTFTVELPQGLNAQLSSYPPAVPLLKATVATLAGKWSEPLFNGLHVWWYLAVLALLFCMLRRWLPLPWALLGLYAYASLPLPLLHGTNAYADTFLSAHVLAAVSFLVAALRGEPEDREALLRVCALMGALLPFTKNEGLLVYGGAFALIFGLALLTLRPTRRTLLTVGAFALSVLVPWLLFKWGNDLTFGNAKAVSGLGLGFEPQVLRVVMVHLFFEGNWHLLFYACVALLALEWRTALVPPLRTVTLFVSVTVGAQIVMYLCTSLAIEALKQTGFGRGILHVVPLIVFLTAVLAFARFGAAHSKSPR